MSTGAGRIRISLAITVVLVLILGASPIATQFVTLAAGTVSSSSQTFNVSATVQPGDFVYFSIGPGPRGDFHSDSTQLDVTITSASDSERKLFMPLIVRQGTPNPPPVLASPGDENWSDEFGLPWLNAPVLALADDGAGGVYLGGEFTGDFSYIARWDGQRPRGLGAGMNSRVRALAVDSAGNLYAGGSFTTAGGVGAHYIARWDGSAWRPLGAGLDGDVFALATDAAGNVYVGGGFTTAGGGPASNIARWDGTAWYPLGAGTNANVLALAVDSAGNVYAGGAFTQAGGATANYVARWDGATWAPLGSGMQGAASPYVYALVVDAAGHLVAGGAFTAAGGTAAPGLARWNGSTWSGFGAGLAGGPVRALAVTEMGEVLAGGSFTEAGRGAASRVARWSRGQWHALGQGVDGTVYAVAPAAVSGQVYAGGSFTSPRFFTRWDGVRWRAFGAGLDGETALGMLVAPDRSLIVAGRFTNAGDVTVNAIGRWDGAGWSAFGAGLRGGLGTPVMDSRGNLYVGGDFGDPVGGVYYHHVAKWDGVAWRPLGAGLHDPPTDLAIDRNDAPYAVGGQTIGPLGWIARWDGATWQPIGAGGWNCMNIMVWTLAIDPAGGLYAGGMFTMAGGQPVRYIAKWDGVAWRQLGVIDDEVFHLTFDPAGNLWAAANSVIAWWDGTAWRKIGSTTEAWAVAIDPAGHVYTTGRFNAIDGVPVSYIAMWDGTAWRPLGSGLVGGVNPASKGTKALTLDGKGNLFVGGWFYAAGDKLSSHIARWTASDSRQVSGPGSYTLYVDNLPVTVHVKQQGTLRYLYAQRHDKSHPNAESGLDTGYFWEIVGADAAGNLAAGYTVDLTLSTAFNPDAADRVCQLQGSTWDCAATLLGESSVTRTDVANLSSFWAVQDNIRSPLHR